MRFTQISASFMALVWCVAAIYIQPIRLRRAWRKAGPKSSKGQTIMNLTSIAHKLNAWRRYRTSVRELSRLSDRELSDLGIGRADIEFVARKAVRARFAG
jgi:uncharacterized protein YjiS (DUF1127 family)